MAAIYSEANPSRAAEIWQYIHVINTATSSYIWENVANYNFTFRQLMSAYPQRNWGKIYSQMWNMSIRDLIQKNFGAQGGVSARGNFNQNASNISGGSNGSVNGQAGRKKPNYCWTFNKGSCKDPKCRFVNRCPYCDTAEHGIFACPKAKKAGVMLVTQQQQNNK